MSTLVGALFRFCSAWRCFKGSVPKATLFLVAIHLLAKHLSKLVLWYLYVDDLPFELWPYQSKKLDAFYRGPLTTDLIFHHLTSYRFTVSPTPTVATIFTKHRQPPRINLLLDDKSIASATNNKFIGMVLNQQMPLWLYIENIHCKCTPSL